MRVKRYGTLVQMYGLDADMRFRMLDVVWSRDSEANYLEGKSVIEKYDLCFLVTLRAFCEYAMEVDPTIRIDEVERYIVDFYFRTRSDLMEEARENGLALIPGDILFDFNGRFVRSSFQEV